MSIVGNAGFKYDPGTGVVTVPLNAPLYNPEPADGDVAFESTSMDTKTRKVMVVSSDVEEIDLEIRHIDNPRDVLDMLKAGGEGIELDYYVDLAGAKTFTAELVAPKRGEAKLSRDPQTGLYPGWYRVAIRLRRTDGGNFDAIL